MTKNHRIPSDYFSFIRGQFSHDHFQQRRLSTPVRPHNSNAFAFLEDVIELFDQQLIRETFGHLVKLQDLSAQALRVQFQGHFSVVNAFLRCLLNVLESVYSILGFSRACARCSAHPIQLFLKQLFGLVQIGRLVGFARLFLFQIITVIPLVLIKLKVFEFVDGSTYAL